MKKLKDAVMNSLIVKIYSFKQQVIFQKKTANSLYLIMNIYFVVELHLIYIVIELILILILLLNHLKYQCLAQILI